MGDYEFLQPLDEEPENPKKDYSKPTLAQKILTEFVASKLQWALIPTKKLTTSYKSAASAARAIGRVRDSMELENIEVFSRDDGVCLKLTTSTS